MKICAAQIRPAPGKVEDNIDRHLFMVEKAISKKADCIVFPELSITGYEPNLPSDLATDMYDPRFGIFQTSSEENAITICLGIPIRSASGIQISMLIFQPGRSRQVYSKCYLHADEAAFFVPGDLPLTFKVGNEVVAPAICYESLLPLHMEKAFAMRANLYVASVAKPQRSLDKAFQHYAKVARKYSMPVMMVNSIGPCDDFIGAGQSAVWNAQGQLLGQLDDTRDGLLLFDSLFETLDIEVD